MLKKFLAVLLVFSFSIFSNLVCLSNTIQRAKEESTKVFEDANVKIVLDNLVRNDALDGQDAVELTHYCYKKLTITNLSENEIKIEGNVFNRVSRSSLMIMLAGSLKTAAKAGGYITGGQQALNYVSKSVVKDDVFDYTLKPKEKKDLVFVMPISVDLKGKTFWRGKVYDAQGSNPYIAINFSGQGLTPTFVSYNLDETSAKELLEADQKKKQALQSIQDELKKGKALKAEKEKQSKKLTKQRTKNNLKVAAEQSSDEEKTVEEKTESSEQQVDKKQIIESIHTLKDLNEAVYKFALIDGSLDKNKLSGIYIYNGDNFDDVLSKAKKLENQVKMEELTSKGSFTKAPSKFVETEGISAKDSFKQNDLHILVFQNAKGLPMLRSLELFKMSVNKEKNTRFAYKRLPGAYPGQSINQIQFAAKFVKPGVYALNFKEHPFNNFEKLSPGEYVIKFVGSQKGYDFRIEDKKKEI